MRTSTMLTIVFVPLLCVAGLARMTDWLAARKTATPTTQTYDDVFEWYGASGAVELTEAVTELRGPDVDPVIVNADVARTLHAGQPQFDVRINIRNPGSERIEFAMTDGMFIPLLSDEVTSVLVTNIGRDMSNLGGVVEPGARKTIRIRTGHETNRLVLAAGKDPITFAFSLLSSDGDIVAGPFVAEIPSDPCRLPNPVNPIPLKLTRKPSIKAVLEEVREKRENWMPAPGRESDNDTSALAPTTPEFRMDLPSV